MPKKTQQIGLSIFQSLPPSNSYIQISKDQFMITISGLNPWQLTHGAGKATYQVWSSPSLVTNTNPLSLISLPGWWVASARLFFFFYSSIVGLQCCINFCCIEKWLGYTHIPILFHILFHLWFITGYWKWFPELHSRTLLVIYSIYASLHMLTPDSQFIPFPLTHPHPFPWQPQICSLGAGLFLIQHWSP